MDSDAGRGNVYDLDWEPRWRARNDSNRELASEPVSLSLEPVSLSLEPVSPFRCNLRFLRLTATAYEDVNEHPKQELIQLL